MTTLQDRPNTALLVVDVQNGVVTGNHERDAVVANVASLVDKAREQDVPVVWVQHNDDEALIDGSEAWQIVPELIQERFTAEGAKLIRDYKVSESIVSYDHSPKLKDLLAKHRPNIVILTLGANDVFVPYPLSIAGSIERIVKPDLLASTGDSFWGLFSDWHAWFTQQACSCCGQVTVYFVDKIQGSSDGFTFWGDNWCRVDGTANTDPTIMAHEIGHICNLWHDDDNNNLMFPSSGPPTNPRNTLTSFQCCTMRLSTFVSP